MTEKVFAAMSGGVDSSVAALLLMRQGYKVSGVTLKLFDNEDIGLNGRSRPCCAESDVEDARRVCHKLGLDHQVFNFCAPFAKDVIARFGAAYAEGRTPNPCIDCNRYIKFGKLRARARLLGINTIATGHYARVEYDEQSGRWLLKKALDSTKDQTYVLYALNQEELSGTLLPLGNLTKNEVRAMAEAHGLANADKPDSQDICFVKDGDYAGFLTRVLGLDMPPGNFIDSAGRVLGRHQGLHRYTIGQRKGIGISFGEPRYVVALDAEHNTVTLGEEAELYRSGLIAADVNFISIPELRQPLRVGVKTRYKQLETPATIAPLPDGRVEVRFDTPQRAITPGQAAVFYDGDIVVGGGTIL